MTQEREAWRYRPETPRKSSIWDFTHDVLAIASEKSVNKRNVQTQAFVAGLFHEAEAISEDIQAASNKAERMIFGKDGNELVLSMILARANLENPDTYLPGVRIMIRRHDLDEDLHAFSANGVSLHIQNPEDPAQEVVLKSSTYHLARRFHRETGIDIDSKLFDATIIQKSKPEIEMESENDFIERRAFEVMRIGKNSDNFDESTKSKLIGLKIDLVTELFDIWLDRQESGVSNSHFDIFETQDGRIQVRVFVPASAARLGFVVPKHWLIKDTDEEADYMSRLIRGEGIPKLLVPQREDWRFNTENPQTNPVWNLSEQMLNINTETKSKLEITRALEGFEPEMLQPIYDEKNQKGNSLLEAIYDRASELADLSKLNPGSPAFTAAMAKRNELILELILAKANLAANPERSVVDLDRVRFMLFEYYKDEQLHSGSINRICIELRDPNDPRNKEKKITLYSNLSTLSNLFGEVTDSQSDSVDFYENVFKKVGLKRKHETTDQFISRRFFELTRIQSLISATKDDNEKARMSRLQLSIYRELTTLWVQKHEHQKHKDEASNLDFDLNKTKAGRLKYTMAVEEGRPITFTIPSHWIFNERYKYGEVAKSLIDQKGQS